jgi:hypothetical protein
MPSTEDTTDDVKDSFYEELESVFDKFPKYKRKILLREFNAKVDRADFLKPTHWNGSLQEISNDTGIRVVTTSCPKINFKKYHKTCSHIYSCSL